jgi:hypothetical protein
MQLRVLTLKARFSSALLLPLVGVLFLADCAGNPAGSSQKERSPTTRRLEFIGRCDVGAEAHSVAVSGDTAYVSLGLKGLAIVDVANPRAPRLVRRIESGIAPVFVALEDKRAYVADRYEGIQILDLARRGEPQISARFVLPPFVTHLALTPKLVFAACGGEGLHVLRKDGETSLTRIGLFRDVKFSRYVLLDHHIAYLADGYDDAFKILDVSVPERMELLSATNIEGYCDAVAKRGAFVFLASRSDGIVVMDVSHPKTPKLVTRIKKPGFWVKNLEVSGNVLVVANDLAGIELYDVTECEQPRLLDTFDTAGRAVWVKILPPAAAEGQAGAGDMVYVADWQGGLLILRIAPAK